MPQSLFLQNLPEIARGKWLYDGHAGEEIAICGVFDDSRCVTAGSLFVAIAGEITDGHRFIESAVQRGAVAVIVQEAPGAAQLAKMREMHCSCLQVADSLAAYQRIAAWHRRQFPQLCVVAITGSCGKTSTKEMIAAIAEKHFPGGVLKTIGSTNNHFGVPRNLLRIDGTTRVAIIELGTNHPGEIANLAQMVQPDIGVVSNIGRAHLEFFHDLHGVAEEKSELLAHTNADGIVIYSHDAASAEVLERKAGTRKCITFGSTSQNDITYRYLGAADDAFAVELHWADGVTLPFQWRIGGEHMAANAACAAAVATALGCTREEIIDGLSQCVLPGERLEKRVIDGAVWINDAFNANPDSMRAAIDYFAQNAPADAQQFLVLGDMLELGGCAAQSHREILDYARQKCPVAQIWTLGALMAQAAEDNAAVRVFTEKDALRTALQSQVRAGSWVLLKSSHSIGLANLIPQ